jgi:hypothetical protein
MHYDLCARAIKRRFLPHNYVLCLLLTQPTPTNACRCHHNCLAGRCSVVIRPTQASVVDYLNLGEVELFDMAGQKLAPASLVFTLGSTWDNSGASQCNDGNPATTCHTQLTTPTLAITYPCAGPTSVSKVVVTNRVDCCKERIVKFTMDFLNATGNTDRPSYQFPTPQVSYAVTVPGAGASTVGSTFMVYALVLANNSYKRANAL